MRRLAMGLMTVGVAALTQSSASAQAKPSENQQPAAAASAAETGMVHDEIKIELVPSPLPRTLEDWLGASQLLPFIQLCDPVPCLGEPPKLLRIDGMLTIRFPATYAKPDSAAKAPPQPTPPPAKPAGEQPSPHK